MSKTFEIEIEDHSDEVLAAVAANIDKALDLMGEVVEGHAKEDCPVDTGLLRNSITHAVGGQAMSATFHASYGSNRSSGGARVSAGSKNAGSVGVRALSGTMGSEGDQTCYIGTNVEYAPYVEFMDNKHHNVGKAHFLRDGAMNHQNELKAVAEAALSSI